jgi:hypothetical protein
MSLGMSTVSTTTRAPATSTSEANGHSNSSKLSYDKPRLRPFAAAGAVPSVPAPGVFGGEALGERIFASPLAERVRDLTPTRHAKLLTKHVAVRLRRSRRDAEPLSDFFVGATRCNQLYDLPLPWSQDWRALLQRRRHVRDANNGVSGCL